MTNSLVYQNVVEELLRRVPEFAAVRLRDESYLSHQDRSPYLVFGDFARFLLDHVSDRSKQDKEGLVLRRSFALLDEMLTSSDPELVNLAQVGVFEVLADQPDALAAAKCYLTDAAKSVLEDWLEKWLAWLRRN